MSSFIVTLLLAYAVFCILLFILQRQMIYFPTSEVSVAGVPHIVLDSGEARIKVWTLNPHRERAIIYFGGNAENVAYNVDDFKTMFPAHTVYLVNYRGYGGSSGSPSESALYADALLTYDHFSKSHSSVSVMGRSVGSAVATYLASERDVGRLLLITPFDSAVSVGKRLYPIFPIGLILQEKLDSKSRADRIEAETMIIGTKDDEIIPYANTKALAESFSKTKLTVVELSEVGHNTIQLHPAYEKTVSEFMNR
ncbi:MAG: hypothetical protein R3302_09455 [Sulfurimonadaceae bacterium]|nr:hypothetical protein [Sulfurimonadaceae bacterium]